ncbi:DUF6273 domain-containing protein [Oscillospiraceae bacterium OttesenSCG-928-G22]|nr:DUF6273 domain-containing protein [Oscillospiraceae bacterium OttesenSCG-928-G22]
MHQGSPSTLYNGFEGGTILLMKDLYESRQWHSSNSNDYANSTIHSYLNNAFLVLIDEKIRAEIKQVKIPYRPGTSGTSVNSGANGLSTKVWLLGGYEVNWTTSTNQYFPVDGTTLSYFAGTAATDPKRIGYLNGTATFWWLRSPNTHDTANAWSVFTNGYYSNYNCSYSGGIRPALVLPSSLLVSDTGEIITNPPPAPPPSITVPGTAISTQPINVSWAASTDPEGDTITYILERRYNGGSYAQVASQAGLTFSETVSASWNTVQYRVKARGSYGNESAYTTSNTVTVIHNQPPVISGEDGDLGTQTEGFSYTYSVTDADADTVTVTESVDASQIRSYTVVLGAENSAEVAGNHFLNLDPGPHTLTITATDTVGNTATRTMTFTKQIVKLSIELTEPLPAAAQPRRANITVTRQIPAGATFRVEATNNPFDAVPVWEDCTNAVLSNLAHVFSNTTNVSPQYGMSIRVFAERGRAIGDCWVSGIAGTFE